MNRIQRPKVLSLKCCGNSHLCGCDINQVETLGELVDGQVIRGLAVSPAGQLERHECAAADALRLDEREKSCRL